MKKTVKLAAVLIAVLWFLLHLISAVEYRSYSPPAVSDNIDAALDRSVYRFFAMTSALGAACSALLAISMLAFWGKTRQGDVTVKKTLLFSAGSAALLFHIWLILVFTVNGDWILWILAGAAVCMLFGIALLLMLSIRCLKHKKQHERT